MKLTSTCWVKILSLPAMTLAAVGMFALVGANTASANGSGAGIQNSPHDFAKEDWNFRGEICRTCHVPHDHTRSTGIINQGLLWNHKLSDASYTMYTSPTLTGAQDPQPTGIAKLCLGCHDGTVGLAQFDKNVNADSGSAVGQTSGTPVGTGPFIQDVDADFQIPGLVDGTNRDLRGTHPISIVYDDVADTGLNPKTTTMGTSGTIDDVLDGGKVQCSSCHDVHDGPEAVPNTHLLRVAQKGGSPSGLCLTCHDK